MRRTTSLLLVPLSLAGIACGDAIDPVTGGEGSGATGFAVVLTDDPANDPAPGPQRVGPAAITAELEGSIRIALRNEADDLVDIGIDQDAFLELQQAGDSLELRGLTRPATDTYVAIQIRFEGVTVTVFQGSEVGDTTLSGTEAVGLGSGGLATVEIATLPFDIDSESVLDLVLDLNSELWITGDNLEAGIVPQADLTNAITLEIP